MSAPFQHLRRRTLDDLALALEGGRIASPFGADSLRRHVSDEHLEAATSDLEELDSKGWQASQIATLLRALAQERRAAQDIADRVELVWSGTTIGGTTTRDTAVLVQELFRRAKQSVLVASYALDQGAKAEAIFGALAKRMDNEPELAVRLYVNVHREHGDQTGDAVLLREFADRFRENIWPGKCLPEVFYDPRSLGTAAGPRACLHAKCVVIDQERALVSSANFTEAAHGRNIEAGVLVADPALARALCRQFDVLVDQDALRRVPGL